MLSHLRLVVSVSRQYLGYGLPHGDLIQEGNVGLMKAVRRFDPEQGVRLVSYALHWIKAEIHEYILKNWRMVKVATTKAQRKLFFNLRSMKQGLKSDVADADTHRNTLTPAEVDVVARELNVKPEEVIEMEMRLSGGDVALEPQNDDGEESYAPIAYLADDSSEPTRAIEARHRDWLAGDGIDQALDVLDARSRRIVEERWLKVNDDASGGMTLHELAAEYGVSAERIRQIEVAALKKMRKALEPAPRPEAGNRSHDAATAGAAARSAFGEQQLQVVLQRLGAAAVAREQPHPALRRRRRSCRRCGRSCSCLRRLARHLRVEDLEVLGAAACVCASACRAARRSSGRSCRRRPSAPAGVSRSGSTVTNTPCTRSPSAPSALLDGGQFASVVGQTSGHCVKPKKTTVTLPLKSARLRGWPLASVRPSAFA